MKKPSKNCQIFHQFSKNSLKKGPGNLLIKNLQMQLKNGPLFELKRKKKFFCEKNSKKLKSCSFKKRKKFLGSKYGIDIYFHY